MNAESWIYCVHVHMHVSFNEDRLIKELFRMNFSHEASRNLGLA